MSPKSPLKGSLTPGPGPPSPLKGEEGRASLSESPARELNKLYDTESAVTESRQVDLAVLALIEESSGIYENIVATLTDNQLSLMRGLARQGTVTEINGSSFVRASGLKSSSSVNSALKSLIDKELVYHDHGQYSVYDRFMALWLCSR